MQVVFELINSHPRNRADAWATITGLISAELERRHEDNPFSQAVFSYLSGATNDLPNPNPVLEPVALPPDNLDDHPEVA